MEKSLKIEGLPEEVHIPQEMTNNKEVEEKIDDILSDLRSVSTSDPEKLSIHEPEKNYMDELEKAFAEAKRRILELI